MCLSANLLDGSQFLPSLLVDRGERQQQHQLFQHKEQAEMFFNQKKPRKAAG